MVYFVAISVISVCLHDCLAARGGLGAGLMCKPLTSISCGLDVIISVANCTIPVRRVSPIVESLLKPSG
eukprot:1154136-Amphidinium_carterae.1